MADFPVYNESFGRQIAEACNRVYHREVKKRGKPQHMKEWTLMAGIVMHTSDGEQGTSKVLSIGTGSKCLGKSLISGHVVHDSHAEVIARRAFLRVLYRELQRVKDGEKGEFLELSSENGKCKVKKGVTFHFYTSHTPCGDASIIDKETIENESEYGTKASEGSCKFNSPTIGDKRQSTIDTTTQHVKRHKTDENERINTSNDGTHITDTPVDDIHRTGAKCVPGAVRQDERLPGAGYHVTGVLRTKPGRSERTMSMCCSDKLALWSMVGVQGALAMHCLHQPVYLTTITVGRCPYSSAAMQRAIITRLHDNVHLPPPFSHHPPVLLHSDVEYTHSKATVTAAAALGAKITPASASIVWTRDYQEAIVQGRRQGFTPKNYHKARSSICQHALFEEFVSVAALYDKSCRELSTMTYGEAKTAAVGYQAAKQAVFTVWHEWIRTPRCLYQFTVSSDVDELKNVVSGGEKI